MYAGKLVAQLNEVEVNAHSKALVLKISVVTGWPIPENEQMRNILFDQLVKKMREDYSNLNIQEIEYAIRKHGTKIKDWGKSMNLTLIDEAVDKYLIQRREVRRLEESEIVLPELSAGEPIIDEDEFIETVKNLFKSMQKIGLIPVQAYDILVKQGSIDLTNEEKKVIREQTERRLAVEHSNADPVTQKELNSIKRNFPDQWEAKVRNECKRQAAAIYLAKQIEIDNF